MEYNLVMRPHCSACHSFLDESGTERTVTSWLSPVVILHQKEFEDKTKIIWSCSMGYVCLTGCVYARRRRPQTQTREERSSFITSDGATLVEEKRKGE